MLKQYPIKTGSRHDLVYYLCDLHNHVNKRLHKPIFDCDKAFNVWGGDCGCGGDKKENNQH
jgi:FAD-linked sulfhydryl oxidase